MKIMISWLRDIFFPEIARRTNAFLESNPGAQVLRLGIGDTTEPIVSSVVDGLRGGVDALASLESYSGYGPSEGISPLREGLAKLYAERGLSLDPSEFFVSDGAKSDSANIQGIFSEDCVVAVQDPAYPVYVDSNVIAGRTGLATDSGYDGLVYMPCTESNGFFPDLPTRKVDLIYICSPNNPTGAVATKEQLKKFVDYANEYKAVIFFDSAYAAFITDPDLPRSIYEVEEQKIVPSNLTVFLKLQVLLEFASHGQSYPKPVVPRILVPVSFIHFGLAGKTPSSMEHQTLFKRVG